MALPQEHREGAPLPTNPRQKGLRALPSSCCLTDKPRTWRTGPRYALWASSRGRMAAISQSDVDGASRSLPANPFHVLNRFAVALDFDHGG